MSDRRLGVDPIKAVEQSGFAGHELPAKSKVT